jgi:GntR family transcriptional regulator, rspAB operon transcriptional repressor
MQPNLFPEGIDNSAFRTRTFADEAVKVIRHLILSGHFAPGERLNELQLAGILQISRSPIREALKALSSAGLVRMVPGRGAFVADFDLTTVRHLIEVRLALECTAARIVAERATDEQIDAIGTLLVTTRRMLDTEPDQAYPRDLDFHTQVLLATDNPPLVSVAGAVSTQVQLARTRSGKGRAEQAYAEHDAVYKALRARDPAAAEQAMREHIMASFHNIERMLGENED